jgi:Ca2+-binding EF-hand superfamily protein
MTSHADIIKQIFETYDKDNDGTLSKAELIAAFDDFKAKGLASGDFDAWFNSIDKDGDGTVNPEEFTAYLAAINYSA